MVRTSLSTGRIIAALTIAMIADAIQLPLNAAFGTVVLSAFALGVIFVVDVVTAALTIALLGFHWALLPSMLAEVIPGLDIFPTWTACVAYVAWSRKKGERCNASPPSTLDAGFVELPPAPAGLLHQPATGSASSQAPLADRLDRLSELRHRGHITESEYETKRRQMLGEL